MPEDTVAILTALNAIRDHLDVRLDQIHTRVSALKEDVHQLDKRIQHIETTCQPIRKDGEDQRGKISEAIVLLATTYPRAFFLIVLSLIGGYPVAELIQSFLVQLADAAP